MQRTVRQKIFFSKKHRTSSVVNVLFDVTSRRAAGEFSRAEISLSTYLVTTYGALCPKFTLSKCRCLTAKIIKEASHQGKRQHVPNFR